MIGLIGSALALMRWGLDGGVPGISVLIALIAGFCLAATPTALRFGASARQVVWVGLGFGVTGLMTLVLAEGPATTAVTPLLVLSPVFIALSLSPRDTLRAAVLTAFVMIAAHVAQGLGLIGPANGPPLREIVLKCAVLLAMLFMLSMILANFAAAARAANDRLAEAGRVAQAANQAKSQFLATASHELRTPLNGVIGMSQILLTTELSAKQRKMAEIVDASGVALLKILNDVFDATEINSGLFRVSTAPFDVDDLARAVIVANEQAAWNKGLGLTLTVERAARGRYQGDHVRIAQMLGRLVENAVKFTEEGVVSLRVSRSGKGLTLFEVADAGPGLSEADQAVIFNLFQQADQSERRRYGGLGLGLANARTLAELMQGDLTVCSEPGRGATFTLSLPLPRAVDHDLRVKLAM